jgi:hypothetical protein
VSENRARDLLNRKQEFYARKLFCLFKYIRILTLWKPKTEKPKAKQKKERERITNDSKKSASKEKILV